MLSSSFQALSVGWNGDVRWDNHCLKFILMWLSHSISSSLTDTVLIFYVLALSSSLWTRHTRVLFPTPVRERVISDTNSSEVCLKIPKDILSLLQPHHTVARRMPSVLS